MTASFPAKLGGGRKNSIWEKSAFFFGGITGQKGTFIIGTIALAILKCSISSLRARLGRRMDGFSAGACHIAAAAKLVDVCNVKGWQARK
jgi:hypothetical protein